jgi:DNA-binding transcriptional LysR family regulator
MDLSALADFNLVAKHGGFGKASRASGRPKATLSRRVTDLEEGLGVRLLERGAHSLCLTEEGQTLFTRTDGLLGEIREIERALGAGTAKPSGLLRISAPVVMSHTTLGRLAAQFQHAYPEVRLEITAEDRMVDLVQEGYDIVIRNNPRSNDELVGRRFLDDQWLVVAPPALTRPAWNADPGAPVPVPAVMLKSAPEGGTWKVGEAPESLILRPLPLLRLSSLLMVRDAVRAGAGAAELPESLVGEDLAAGSLVSWGLVPERKVELWVLHTSRRLASPKVTAFVQFLCEAFA